MGGRMLTEAAMRAWTDVPEQMPGYPFRGPGTLIRVVPFAGIAVLAEASLALMPGSLSPWAVGVSLVLLLAVAASFALPWGRLPDWPAVLVPLAYVGSALALTLAAGPDSGVGIVTMVPLVWTALFHRRWHSASVLVAIVTVEVVLSLTPTVEPDAVIARRVVLWAALGTVIAFATHELREQNQRSRRETVTLQAQLTGLTVAQDRDRIAADLQDNVVQQLLAAGMNLQSIAMLATEPEVRKRVLETADQVDGVLRLTRNAVSGLGRRRQERGLRAEIVALCERISPVPEVIFSGPADDALDPDQATRLVQTLRDALEAITSRATPRRVVITASRTACTVEIDAGEMAAAGSPRGSDRTSPWHALLAKSISAPDISLRVRPASDGIQFIWSLRLPATPG
jgi:signal transduction histidine kinase